MAIRLPWVSRALYDGVRFLLDAQVEATAADRREIARLTDVIIGMKRQNYHAPDPSPTPVAVEPLGAVELAVRKLPRNLRAQVMGEVVLWRAQRMTEEQIARRIELGEEAYRETS